MTLTSRYVLQSDRLLRVVFGPPATTVTSPANARRVSPAQYRHVYDIIQKKRFFDTTHPSITFQTTPSVRYDLTLTAHGQTRQITLTPEQTPTIASLVQAMINLYAHAFGE